MKHLIVAVCLLLVGCTANQVTKEDVDGVRQDVRDLREQVRDLRAIIIENNLRMNEVLRSNNSISTPPSFPTATEIQKKTDNPEKKTTTTGTDTGTTTKSGQTIYEGSRGGHYHYSKSGNKVYEKKK